LKDYALAFLVFLRIILKPIRIGGIQSNRWGSVNIFWVLFEMIADFNEIEKRL
jgi:hypothetical protein